MNRIGTIAIKGIFVMTKFLQLSAMLVLVAALMPLNADAQGDEKGRAGKGGASASRCAGSASGPCSAGRAATSGSATGGRAATRSTKSCRAATSGSAASRSAAARSEKSRRARAPSRPPRRQPAG